MAGNSLKKSVSIYKLYLPNFNTLMIGWCKIIFINRLHLKKCIKSIHHMGFVIAMIHWTYWIVRNRKLANKHWATKFPTCYCVFTLINWKGSLCSKVEYNCLLVFDIDKFISGCPVSICKSTHTMIIVYQLSQCNCWTLVIAKPMEFIFI